MKLTELQSVLGEEILNVRKEQETQGDFSNTIQRAQTVALLAKQVINTADIIIRFDKLKSSSPELSTRIGDMI
jgi:hypothetical protein